MNEMITKCFFALMTVVSVYGQGSLPVNYTVLDIIASRCKSSESCYPTQAQIDQLDQSMEGYVIGQTDAQYTAMNLMYNVNQQRTTSLIAVVMSKEDIQKAVVFARDYNLHVTIKSTGHDYSGRSTWEDSFVIHLGLMNETVVQTETTARSEYGELRTQTGTNWKTIYLMLDGYNRTIVGGSAHTVGPGGYTLGGGHSPISKTLGYAVDNVLEMQVVLADGSIATCTDTQTVIIHQNGTTETRNDGDLLWALRGGGGGTFGVTVYITFKLHPQPSQMVTLSGTFPLIFENPLIDTYDEMMTALRKFITNSPSHWGGYWILQNSQWTFGQYRFRGSYTLFMNKFGPWDGNIETEVADFLALRDKYSLTDVVLTNRSSFWDYERNAYDPPSSDVYLVTSMLSKDMAESRFNTFFETELFDTMRDLPVGCTGILVGGKTTEPSIASSPLNPGYRNAVSVISCGMGLAGSGNNRSNLIESARSFAYRIRTMGEGMYFNEPSIDSQYWREDYWGLTNYARLSSIKSRYDPDNMFTCYHCVGSEYTVTDDTGSTTTMSSITTTESGSSGSARNITTKICVILSIALTFIV